MTTVWVAGDARWGGDGRAEDYVDLVIEDLTGWLRELVGSSAPEPCAPESGGR